MQKARTFLILGIWVAILPYLGFPYAWKNIIFTLTGLVIMFFSYVLYKEYKIKETKQKIFDSFKENGHFGARAGRPEPDTFAN
jgi:hypothetical protein